LLPEFEGGMTAGPLLPPGLPCILLVSCGEVLELVCCEVALCPGFAAGPFLFPGCPAMPAPELVALGLFVTGLLVCAKAGDASMASMAAAFSKFIFTSELWDPRARGNVRERFGLPNRRERQREVVFDHEGLQLEKGA
jgi:hypothetical protein